VTGLAARPLADLLDAFAQRTAAPGGGSAAAVAAALAAALSGMAAAFAGDRAALELAADLRDRALALADAEMTAYAPVLEAQRLDRDDPGRPALLAAALAAAADQALAVAALAADAAELAARLAREGRPALAGDAATGAVVAEAACRGALRLAELDLVGAERAHGGEQGPDPRFATIAALAERAALAREEALR
jgi:glutamate formiminotransferase/formiminotetrahydrofolate cyclodeaminase